MFWNRMWSDMTEPRHIRRTRAYLQEARMAMLEHSIAAEHYQASAEMYAQRVARLEEDLRSWEVDRLQAGEVRRPELPPSGPTPVGIVRAA